VWHDKQVPPVLLSGHHGNVDRWRREQSILRTLHNRPELLFDVAYDKKDYKYLRALVSGEAESSITEEEKGILLKLLAISGKA
jgi:tRNA (guanine37-N1)-methyltransferase